MSDKKTPLYHTHIDLGGNMVSFGGFLLPTHYSGINHEHMIVRSKAGLFDVSHMGEFIISGTDAETFLQKVTVNDVQSLEVSQAHYSAMCYEHGGIVDDLLVYKKEDEFMVVVNASNREKDLEWLTSNIQGNVTIKDISDKMALIAIQGPRSRDILQMLTDSNLSNLSFYHFIDGKVSGRKAIISRTGYTGELGYEIYSSSDDIINIWTQIMDAGLDHGIEPVGLGCRDTLRMEMKYTLYGNDIDEKTNPIEMAEKAIPRNGCPIFIDEELVGVITSGTMSPSLEKGIGIGFVNTPYTEAGTDLIIDIRGNKKPAVIVKPPFYTKGSLMD